MLRNKNLIPLSHQHQRALGLCVRIDRASPVPDRDLEAWQAEVAEHFRTEIVIHFAAEEQVLFPAARRFEELNPLIDELVADHAWLRIGFAAAASGQLTGFDLSALGQRLSVHIRKEERQLFERLQRLMSDTELALLGEKLEDALRNAAQICMVPTATTKLRSVK